MSATTRERVLAALAAANAEGCVTQRAVARAAGVSPRTVRRVLAREAETPRTAQRPPDAPADARGAATPAPGAPDAPDAPRAAQGAPPRIVAHRVRHGSGGDAWHELLTEDGRILREGADGAPYAAVGRWWPAGSASRPSRP